MSSNPMKKWLELEERRRELETELKDVKNEKAEWEERAIEWMTFETMDSVRMDGVTISMKRDLFPGPVGDDENRREVMIESLKSNEDTAYLINETANYQSLGAWMRSLERDENDMPIIPDGIKVQCNEKLKLTARKS